MRAIAMVVAGALVLSCGGAAAPAPPQSATTVPATATVARAPGATAAPATTAAATQVPRPAFLSMRLTDVRTGEQFTLGGFPGKVVLGIAMAVW